MPEWYENESEDEGEQEFTAEREEEARFSRSFRAPPGRGFHASRSFSMRPGAGRGWRGSSRGRAWRASLSPSRFTMSRPDGGVWRGPRSRRRWPGTRPWLMYGRPYAYGYGYPLYQPSLVPPPEDVEPAPAPPPVPVEAVPPEPPDAVAAPAEPAAEPAASQELEVSRGPVTAQVTSWTMRRIDRHPFSGVPAGGGLYVVEEDGVPIYVGATDNFQARWRGRLLAIYQLGLTQRGGVLPKPITVWFGTLRPNTVLVRRTAEHALIRALLLSGAAPAGHLRNASSIQRFRVHGGVSIQGLIPDNAWGNRAARAPGVTNRALSLSDKALYELFGD